MLWGKVLHKWSKSNFVGLHILIYICIISGYYNSRLTTNISQFSFVPSKFPICMYYPFNTYYLKKNIKYLKNHSIMRLERIKSHALEKNLVWRGDPRVWSLYMKCFLQKANCRFDFLANPQISIPSPPLLIPHTFLWRTRLLLYFYLLSMC